MVKDKKLRSAIKKIIPAQRIGNKSGAVAEEKETHALKAIERYETAKKRLLDINNWEKYAGARATSFYLYNPIGRKIKRNGQAGDFIAIDLPGPGTRSGSGYDWVVIEKIKEVKIPGEDAAVFYMQVRPAPSPLKSDQATAHFYTRSATSNFIITRQGDKLKAEESGRNEQPNTKTESVMDNVRNAAVAFTAAHGLAYPQWKSLMKGIIKDE